MSELKLCPFCEGEIGVPDDPEGMFTKLKCRNCGMEFYPCGETFADELEAMNRRPSRPWYKNGAPLVYGSKPGPEWQPYERRRAPEPEWRGVMRELKAAPLQVAQSTLLGIYTHYKRIKADEGAIGALDTIQGCLTILARATALLAGQEPAPLLPKGCNDWERARAGEEAQPEPRFTAAQVREAALEMALEALALSEIDDAAQVMGILEQIKGLVVRRWPDPKPAEGKDGGSVNWNPIGSAPHDATEVRVVMADGTVHERAHWACDLSGEDQPAFLGWFIPYIDSNGRLLEYRGISEPVGWQPIPPKSEPAEGKEEA